MISTNCPTCENLISIPTDQGPVAACPHCEARVFVKKAIQEQARLEEVAAVVKKANSFRILSSVFLIIAFLAGLFILDESSMKTAVAVSGSCFSTAFIFYIIAQILFIRANTHR